MKAQLELLEIAARSAWNRRGTLALVALSVALSTFLLLGVERLRSDVRENFSQSVSGTDLIVGARTGAMQLMLYAVFRVGGATNNVRLDSLEAIAKHRAVAWMVPLSLGDSHRGHPVLGTTAAYFEHFLYGDRQPLALAQGRAFAGTLDGLYEAVLGAEVADALGYTLGQRITLAHGLTAAPGELGAKHGDKPFTVVGATTRAGRISSPLRDRFGATYRLDFYTETELTEIVERSARILGVEIDAGAAIAIARRGRGTPRIVNRLLKRVRDHAEVHGDGRVTESVAREAMRLLEIDDEGLDSTDRKLLAAIVQKFASGPVGVQALAAVLAEEAETIEDVYEPFLLRLGFLDRTPQGRIATEAARVHLARLGFEIPPPRRPEPEMVGLWDLPIDPPATDAPDAPGPAAESEA